MANLQRGYSEPMSRRTPQDRVTRWMNAGAYTMRHWRGILLSIWLGFVAVFGLIAWWGYANRDSGFGAFVFTLFGLVVLAMLIRYPRRLLRSIRTPDRTVPPPPQPRGVIDTDATVRERPRRDPPELG